LKLFAVSTSASKGELASGAIPRGTHRYRSEIL
jgi:hypothetical protein